MGKVSKMQRSVAASFGMDKFKINNGRYKITKREAKGRMGYIFLGLFAGLFIGPVQQFIDSLGLNTFIIGIIPLE